MREHQLERTEGLTYAQMGRFIAADDPESAAGTSDEEAALKDEEGNAISNPARQSWVTAVAITTALNTSYMAEQLSIFGMVVGVALLLTGIGLVILAFAVFGREPATETRSAGPPRSRQQADPGDAGGPDRQELRPPGAQQRGRRCRPLCVAVSHECPRLVSVLSELSRRTDDTRREASFGRPESLSGRR